MDFIAILVVIAVIVIICFVFWGLFTINNTLDKLDFLIKYINKRNGKDV